MIDVGVSRRCSQCKQHRTTGFAVVRKVHCCGAEYSVCEEECKDTIPLVSGMTLEAFVEKYVRMHASVCKGKGLN